MSTQVWWYATRAAGLMTWSTATAAVVTGLLLSTRVVRTRTGPWFLDLHRFLGGISVGFLAAHLITLWADSFVEFGVSDILVPGASEWRPEAIAWGIIAAYLLVAIQVTSLLRSSISARVWRVLHLTSFLAMIAGSYHAVTAGSDVDNPLTWLIAGVGSVLVIALVSMRLHRQDPNGTGLAGADNRAILEEMRQRLADLPSPEGTPQPQICDIPNAALPRRAPVSMSLPGMEDSARELPSGPTIGFTADPFASVPARDGDLAIGDWADPSPVDPFRTITTADRDGEDADGYNLFQPVIPTISAIQEPPPNNDGPPPLPTAVDPVTGEPDKAAYTAWLKDWLVYAESYGDDAPEDPARV